MSESAELKGQLGFYWNNSDYKWRNVQSWAQNLSFNRARTICGNGSYSNTNMLMYKLNLNTGETYLLAHK